ncbi:MAG TPA: hypothetical protein VFH69_08090 [Gemmatimonadota bacterium]|nr:hypothetical protein [Gemmatimonadota bacterium]
MTQSHDSPTALPPGATVVPKAGSAGTAGLPHPPEAAGRRSGWTPGRIAALAIGGLLGLVGLIPLGAGGTALWASAAQRDDGYVTSDVQTFSTAGSALVTEPADLGVPGFGWLYSPSVLGEIRIRVTPAAAGSALFVGIGPSDEVDRYLAGVGHTVIADFWNERVRPVGGDATASAPGSQDFWVASGSGSGPRSVTWDPTSGSWSVVVMNVDGQPGVDVRADLGATIPPLVWISVGLLLFGLVLVAGGSLLVVGAIRRARTA